MEKSTRSENPTQKNVQFRHFGILNDGSQSKASLVSSVIVNIIIGIVMIVASATVQKGIQSPSAFGNLVKAIGLHSVQALAAVVAIACGVLAYRIKRRWQYHYGFAEICFAGISAWHLAAGLSTHEVLLSRWVALIASAYIAARGVGNMADGSVKRTATSHMKMSLSSRS